MRKAAHHHTVPGQLAHVARAQLPHLRCNAVLLHERLLCEVELQRIVRTQRHAQPARQVLGQRIAMVIEEQRVVGQRRHGNADLRQIVQIL